LVAPTGAGKTVIASAIIQSAAAKGRKTLFLAHRQELIAQCHDKLREFGVESGVIQAGAERQLRHLTQVASVQTLVRRLGKDDWQPDLIIIDEAHLATAATYLKIISHYNNGRPSRVPLLGLTATPQRLDGRGLDELFDDLVIAGTTRELIADGSLCPYKYFAPPGVVLEDVRTTAGDYDAAAAAAATDTAIITGDCIKHWLAMAAGAPTMAFCSTNAHADHVASQMRRAGIRALAVSGETGPAERRDALRDIASGALQVLVNCGLFIEGLDCPALACLIDLAMTQSITRYRQKIGRVLRTHAGKSHALILDHVGNVKRHGLPDCEIEWSLQGRKKTPKPPSVRQCPSCYWTGEGLTRQCPECGHVFVIGGHRKPAATVEGDLVEVTEFELAQRRAISRREEARMQTLADWEALARQRGYKLGWARHRFEARQARQRK